MIISEIKSEVKSSEINSGEIKIVKSELEIIVGGFIGINKF